MSDVPRYMLSPLQDEREHNAFIQTLVKAHVRSYLEIGAMYGCSLWKVAMALPKGSRVVAIDPMVDRPDARESLEQCVARLTLLGYQARFIFGDSTEQKIIDQVKALGPFDALFIDGNHSPEYVLADWQNYGPLARIVGFHDISWNKTWISARGNTPDETLMGAPKIWEQVKQGHTFAEFKFYEKRNYYGIGVIFQ